MSDELFLIDESHRKARIEAEEKLVKENTISPASLKEDLQCMLDLFEKYFPQKKVEGEETPGKDKGMTLSLEEAQEKWDLFSEKEKKTFLKTCVSVQDDLREKKDKERAERLPDDIKTLVSLSQKEWNKLPGNGRQLILKKMNFFEKNLRRTPDVKDFSKLSKEKQETVLRSIN